MRRGRAPPDGGSGFVRTPTPAPVARSCERIGRFEAQGVPFCIVAPAGQWRRVATWLPWGSKPTRRPPAFDVHLSRQGSEWVVASSDGDAFAYSSLASALRGLHSAAQIRVAERMPKFVVVHAGVVEVGGLAVLLPGYSLAGKSTLVRALLRAGARLMSDDYAWVDSRGRVHPHARWLHVRPRAGGWGRRVGPPRVDPTPRRVGAVFLLRYEACGGTSWTPLPGARSLHALLEFTVSVRRDPARALEWLGRMLRDVPAFEGTRGEVREAAREVLRIVGEGQKRMKARPLPSNQN